MPYPTYLGLESEDVSIQDYALGIIPGLLQTPDYAREVVRAAVRRWPPEVVEQRVEGRLARQQILVAEAAPQYQAVLDESLLHRAVGSPAIMRAQLEQLLEASRLPTVSIRVIAFDAGPLPAGNNKFIVLSFAKPTIPTVVFVEGLTGDLYLESPDDVKVYTETFSALTEMAQCIRRVRRDRQAEQHDHPAKLQPATQGGPLHGRRMADLH